MKKYIFTTAAIAMIAGTVTFTSCKKEDTTAPVITVTGGNSQLQSLPATAGAGTWTDPTATASDDEDGDLSSSITVSGTVNPNLAGDYTLTYTVSDAAGNTATTDVTVTIANDAAYLAGNYNVKDTIIPFSVTDSAYAYNQTVTPSTSTNGRISFTHADGFAYYNNNTNIYANVSGAVLTLPTQTASNIGQLNDETHQFIGNGVVTTTTVGSGTEQFNITYTDNNQTASATANGIMRFFRQ